MPEIAGYATDSRPNPRAQTRLPSSLPSTKPRFICGETFTDRETGIDAKGKVVIRRQLKRRYVLPFFQKLPSCLVGIQACASSHHWSRELQALAHMVRLMPRAYVKPYVKRQKKRYR